MRSVIVTLHSLACALILIVCTVIPYPSGCRAELAGVSQEKIALVLQTRISFLFGARGIFLLTVLLGIFILADMAFEYKNVSFALLAFGIYFVGLVVLAMFVPGSTPEAFSLILFMVLFQPGLLLMPWLNWLGTEILLRPNYWMRTENKDGKKNPAAVPFPVVLMLAFGIIVTWVMLYRSLTHEPTGGIFS